MKKLKTNEIRQLFLDYFKRQGHSIIESGPLVPPHDPTLFFTNAGMVQFKGVFLGKEKCNYTRAATVQRCLRASGKHNDLDNVGYTNRHHTFFEMLGNFSFGDYFKHEAIHYAWEFLTKELKLDPKKLWITVHERDQEAEKLWQEEFKQTQTTPQGLSYCGDQDNFWTMGETGPCGYCSEIFYDHGDQLQGAPPGGKEEGERYVEIWNLVFMQFERDLKGNLTPLPKPSIDTGMGLERIAAVMQGVDDNYLTDTFKELHKVFLDILVNKCGSTTESLTLNLNPYEAQIGLSKILPTGATKIASRVVIDHIRAAVFLIAEGVMPANEKSGYVLRSIIRRAVYYLYSIGVRRPLFFEMVAPLTKMMDDIYPEIQLATLTSRIAETIEQEEIKFLATLDRGLKILEQEITKLSSNIIPGTVAFNLHDTYGLPIILTAEIARKYGLDLDQAGFATEMEKQRTVSRRASKFTTINEFKLDFTGNTQFVGYTQNNSVSKLIGICKKEGDAIEHLNVSEEGIIILESTPFYAESGGQIGDSGEIHSDHATFIVEDTKKNRTLHLHYGYMATGSLMVNDQVTASIDLKKRQALRLNHSATHLLHQGLRLVLGENAMQKGSLVDDRRLRFDFSHPSALAPAELAELEKIVNNEIRANLKVKTVITSLEAAKQERALALFGEKYSDEVRVVMMGNFSKELCGGTHVDRTGEIGLFKIVSEMSVASGMRRIEAVTGDHALTRIDKIESTLKEAAQLLGVGTEQIVNKIQQITKEKEQLEKEFLHLQNELLHSKNMELVKQAVKINETSILAARLPNADSKILRKIIDDLKQQLSSAVVVLATVNADKIQLIVVVTKDLLNKIQANKLLQYLTQQIDGSGGGKTDLAQGGGNNINALPTALDSVLTWVKDKLP